ncbi:MAG: hypothetical protein J6H20_07840 [Pyramidobacter sp.]|nr:hypothetical protein [Pyramidobacter sp.]MBP3752521.1 hypothetical protein [Pyramidobacter sp.]
MSLNIWPWSRIRELENELGNCAKHCRYLQSVVRDLQREERKNLQCLRDLKLSLALKITECEQLMNALALSPKERKRRRVKIRRGALLWHIFTEHALNGKY